MNKFLTVDEAADRMRIAPFTMRKWLRDGLVKGVKVGRAWRIPEDALTVGALKSQTQLTPIYFMSPDATEEEVAQAKRDFEARHPQN